MSQPGIPSPRYRTNNREQYNAALKAQDCLNIWFAAVSGKRGRSPQFSDATIKFCLTIKNLFGLVLRQTAGFCNRRWPCLDFSLPCLRQRSLDVPVAYRPGSGGLDLLLDSTGIKFLNEGE